MKLGLTKDKRMMLVTFLVGGTVAVIGEHILKPKLGGKLGL